VGAVGKITEGRIRHCVENPHAEKQHAQRGNIDAHHIGIKLRDVHVHRYANHGQSKGRGGIGNLGLQRDFRSWHLCSASGGVGTGSDEPFMMKSQKVKNPFLSSLRRKPESGFFNCLWIPDQSLTRT